MKIAVYTIALNEEKFVEQWYESAKDADYLLIADTGSTDKTIRLAKKLGINVVKISIKPWRFDDARNAALAALPDDIDMCISLDMDEVLSKGWREKLESIDPKTTQVSYKYTWSWRDPLSRTQPQTVFIINKVHARHGYRWNWLVHEIPLPDRNPDHFDQFLEGFEIYHNHEFERDNDRYSTMIDDAFNETKHIPRYWVYKFNTLVMQNKNDEAKAMIFEYISKFKDELTIDKLSEAYYTLYLCSKKENVEYLLKASKLMPEKREYLVSLASHYFNKKKFRISRKYCLKALSITTRRLDISYQEFAWGYLPKNILYVCNHNLKIKNFRNKLTLNVNSLTSSSFDLFKD